MGLCRYGALICGRPSMIWTWTETGPSANVNSKKRCNALGCGWRKRNCTCKWWWWEWWEWWWWFGQRGWYCGWWGEEDRWEQWWWWWVQERRGDYDRWQRSFDGVERIERRKESIERIVCETGRIHSKNVVGGVGERNHWCVSVWIGTGKVCRGVECGHAKDIEGTVPKWVVRLRGSVSTCLKSEPRMCAPHVYNLVVEYLNI